MKTDQCWAASDADVPLSATPQNPSKSRLSVPLFAAIVLVYVLTFLFFERLAFRLVWDEGHYWQTSLSFSQSLLPDLNQLRNYGELSTPLPFVIYGAIEHLFKAGVFASRLLNLVLSFLMTCLICLPVRKTAKYSFFIGCALLSCPYYLWLSSHLYTDIMASFFVFFGFWFYVRSRNVLSGLSFVLAIASRQYMVAFPLAVAAFELFSAQKYKMRIRWLAPVLASLSIVGWALLFGGLTPKMALANPDLPTVPTVQLTWWSLQPNNSLYFLACVGLYFVIPELILFRREIVLKSFLTRQSAYLALGLVLLFVIFPPPLQAHGLLTRAMLLLPNDFFKITLLYSLSLLACVRFSPVSLPFWVVLMNCGMMMKAHHWDKYVLPLLVALWCLKSHGALDAVVGQSRAPVLSWPPAATWAKSGKVSTMPGSTRRS